MGHTFPLCCVTGAKGNEWSEMCGRGWVRKRICIRKLFAHLQMDADATLRVAAERTAGHWHVLRSSIAHIGHVLNKRWFSVSILHSTNHSIDLSCITVKFFGDDRISTEYISDIAAGKTGHRPSADAWGWTAANGISVAADAKICTSADLCKRCLR